MLAIFREPDQPLINLRDCYFFQGLVFDWQLPRFFFKYSDKPNIFMFEDVIEAVSYLYTRITEIIEMKNRTINKFKTIVV